MSYAGFWKRVAAAIIDGIIIMIGGFAIGFVFGLVMVAGGTHDPAVLKGMSTILGLILGWIYFAVMESSPTQGTLGKRAMGIKVTDLKGSKIDFGKATGRYFGKIISALILLIGYIMVAFTQKKQGLHDMMAGCLVVNRASEILNDPVARAEYDRHLSAHQDTLPSSQNTTSQKSEQHPDEAPANGWAQEKTSGLDEWAAEIKKTRVVATVVLVVLYIVIFITSYMQGLFTKSIGENIGIMIGLTIVPSTAYIVYFIYPKHNGAKYVYYSIAVFFIIIFLLATIQVRSENRKSAEQVTEIETPKVEAPVAQPAPEIAPAKKYTDKIISFSFNEVDIRSVLRLMAEYANINIVVSDDVKGTITLSMENVPWEQALDTILDKYGLSQKQMGDRMILITYKQ